MNTIKQFLPLILIILNFLISPINGFTQILNNPVIDKSNLHSLPDRFAFDKKRPVCIVLIHGITASPENNEKHGDVDCLPCLKYARFYWSYEFIEGLFGFQSLGATSSKLLTFSDKTTVGRLSAHPDEWEDVFTESEFPSNHIISSILPRTGSNAPVYPFYTVMLTYRDGSRSLKKQTVDLSKQIRDLYQANFGNWPGDKQPQLILLAHSGGGLVSRAICSKPSSLGGLASSWGSGTIPREVFSSTELADMEFIRTRTMYIITLATPHEGAPIAKVADNIGRHITSWPVVGSVIEEQEPAAPILQELTPMVMKAYNTGPLHPLNCKRTDGTLIPIYTIGGRTPGGPMFYSNPNRWDINPSTPDGGISKPVDEIARDRSNRFEYEAYGLMKADYATQYFYNLLVAAEKPTIGKGYGNAVGEYKFLDMVSIKTPDVISKCLTNVDYQPLGLQFPISYYLFNKWTDNKVDNKCTGQFTDTKQPSSGDGMIDCDGFVPINSALGINLGTSIKDFFSNTTGGSWYRKSNTVANIDNHGSIKLREEVSDYIRKEIIKLNLYSNAANNIVDQTAAGPYTSTSSGNSKWTK